MHFQRKNLLFALQTLSREVNKALISEKMYIDFIMDTQLQISSLELTIHLHSVLIPTGNHLLHCSVVLWAAEVSQHWSSLCPSNGCSVPCPGSYSLMEYGTYCRGLTIPRKVPISLQIHAASKKGFHCSLSPYKTMMPMSFSYICICLTFSFIPGAI